MFSNYTHGVTVTSQPNCCCTPTPAFNTAILDKYGNVVKLQWTPVDRFSISITSDSWIPVLPNSVILKNPGETPTSVAPDGVFAYNTSDCLCWVSNGKIWVEQSDIVPSTCGSTTLLFSNKNCTTRIEIRNFREDVMFEDEALGTEVDLLIDDRLSNKLLQGFYNLDVYQVSESRVRHIRRVPVSVSYTLEPSEPSAPPAPSDPSSPSTPQEPTEEQKQYLWELNHSILGVSTIYDRDSIDTGLLTHGKIVRVSNTDTGVKYYSWNQLTNAWEEQPLADAIKYIEILSDKETEELLSYLDGYSADTGV